MSLTWVDKKYFHIYTWYYNYYKRPLSIYRQGQIIAILLVEEIMLKARISSRVGNTIVAGLSQATDKSIMPQKILGKKAVLSSDNKKIGKVTEIIGRVDAPYLIISLFKKSRSHALIQKEITIS